MLVGVPTSPGVGVGPVARPGHPSTGGGRVGAGRAVVVGTELSPAEVSSLDPEAVAGLACVGGAPLSHAAILARSLGIPTVTGLGPAILEVAPGTVALVDGDAGTVEIAPGPEALEVAVARQRADRRGADEARQRSAAPATTRDGHRVAVMANAGGARDAAEAVAQGADGVGMLRTEFAFLGRAEPPGEEEQYEAYRAVGDLLGHRPLVLRTLDLGADIPVWGGAAETNPALGNRGLRHSLAFRPLLETQLRAVARVAQRRPMQVMFPMVTTIDELRAARSCLDEVAGPGRHLEVGITVEVPAAALTAETLAPLVDFFALGTNDLTQYTLAVDRANAAVAGLADGLHPAVLRLIREVTAVGERFGRPVEVVGELATDPLGVPVLLGLGVSVLSVRPNAVAAVKQAVRQVDLDDARRLAEAALGAESAGAVRALARQYRAAAGERH